MNRGSFFTLCVLLACLCLQIDWPPMSKADEAAATTGRKPADAQTSATACKACHLQQSSGYEHTAHFSTSSLPEGGTVLGCFSEECNVLKISDPAPAIQDPGVSYKMEKRPDGYHESAITGFTGHFQTRSERIDVVIVSGVRGQSYLYWKSDQLFELPVSYWTDGKQWINSPGFRNGEPMFTRVASPRCLECHATFIKLTSAAETVFHYDRGSLVTGIGCETCHGAPADHLALQHQGRQTATKNGVQAILNPAKFSRDRQVDLCALCHNGTQQAATAPAFSYVPGQPLDRYFAPPDSAANTPDVHGNQVGLLKKSRCYLSSPNMSCSTCHEVHAPEKTAASYSSRCLSCHTFEACPTARRLGHGAGGNCIDCHMPVQQTQAIVSETGDKLIRTSMRTHWIKVYPANENP